MLRVAPFGKKGGSFWLWAELGCDYVIHQGSTIKEEEEAVGGWVGGCACGGRFEGNNAGADGHRLATAQGQECPVVRCVRQVAWRS